MRELINKYPSRVAVALGLAVLIGLGTLWLRSPRKLGPGDAPKVYFSDDDGKTFFADARDKPPGFDHGGKPAYVANVFSQGASKPFVGFLRRVGPTSALPTAAPHPVVGGNKFGPGADQTFKKVIPVAPMLMAAPGSTQTEIKEPGDSNWHSLTESAGMAIMKKYGPEGQEASGLEPIMP